ncbi:MAG TPA: hypothetical protein VNN10_10305 [Dehalococcoidia bacterium]|nr:hypothetical protein [Dehalococcoidia bacterium]
MRPRDYEGGREAMPRGIAVVMTMAILTLITGVVMALAVMVWQPWHTEDQGGGIQGGGDPTPAQHGPR